VSHLVTQGGPCVTCVSVKERRQGWCQQRGGHLGSQRSQGSEGVLRDGRPPWTYVTGVLLLSSLSTSRLELAVAVVTLGPVAEAIVVWLGRSVEAATDHEVGHSLSAGERDLGRVAVRNLHLSCDVQVRQRRSVLGLVAVVGNGRLTSGPTLVSPAPSSE
jgi:hypothetical protein